MFESRFTKQLCFVGKCLIMVHILRLQDDKEFIETSIEDSERVQVSFWPHTSILLVYL